MKTKHLSTLCICALTLAVSSRSAEAAIIDFTSFVQIIADAGVYNTDPVQTDLQNVSLNDVTDYSNTVNAFSAGTVYYYDPSCDCTGSLYQSASGTASVDMHADLATGVFSGSGFYSTSSGGGSADGGSYVSMGFTLTTPYAYTLTMNFSQKSKYVPYFVGNLDLSDRIEPHFFMVGDYDNGFSLQQSGVLNEGRVNLISATSGCSDCYFSPSGSFAYTLTLTPSAVPVPAAAWLFGSGFIGLLGMARRKAV